MTMDYTQWNLEADMVAFTEAAHQAREAKKYRGYAKLIRSGTHVYGWTLGLAEADARRCERTVRRLADQSIAAAAARLRHVTDFRDKPGRAAGGAEIARLQALVVTLADIAHAYTLLVEDGGDRVYGVYVRDGIVRAKGSTLALAVDARAALAAAGR